MSAAPSAAAPPAKPRGRVRRDPRRGLVGGVLAGLAVALRVDPLMLRIAFGVGVVLTGGALLVGYAIAWALIPAIDGSVGFTLSRFGHGRGWHLGTGVGLLILAALLVFRELGLWWSDAFVWPLVLVGAGLALLWGQSRGDEPAPATERPGAAPAAPGEGGAGEGGRPSSSLAVLYRGGFGVALVAGAALLFLSSNDALGGARDAAFTAIVSIVALALILAPFIWRLGRNLAIERGERIRSQERAEVAAHLHDSVLQTLTLMQKRAADPREVSALARRQERELRAWLAAGGSTGTGSGDGFAGALRDAAADVEDAYRVAIDVVAVGDCPLDEPAAAVVAAAREALTNAAKFAGDGPISLYAEVGDERIEAYVRDRGPGFDAASVAADRRGVRESIVGRMRRHGGDATISSVPGAGTEIALTLERGAA